MRQINKAAEVVHLKKREGHNPTAGATRTIRPDGEEGSTISAAKAVQDTAAGTRSYFTATFYLSSSGRFQPFTLHPPAYTHL